MNELPRVIKLSQRDYEMIRNAIDEPPELQWFRDLLEMHDKGDKQAVRAAIVAAIKMYERQKGEKRIT